MSYETSYILDHMGKYFPNFNREEYEDKTVEELESICRPHYRENLPVDLQAWFSVNIPEDKMLYKHQATKQIVFIRDTIQHLFFYKEYPQFRPIDVFHDDCKKAKDEFIPMVISTHRSKSIELPVVEINLKSVGVKIVLRDNFYDWNVSIESENDIECDFMDTFKDEKYHMCYCQGFPKDRIYGMYKDDHKKFTCYIDNDYTLFTFMWILRDYLYKEKQDGKTD